MVRREAWRELILAWRDVRSKWRSLMARLIVINSGSIKLAVMLDDAGVAA